MKFSSLLGALALAFTAAPSAFAFPAYMKDLTAEQIRDVQDSPLYQSLKEKRQLPLVVPGVKKIPDADHPFQAPGPDDIRGPCPGLNVMANHGYLSRDGVTNTAELTWAMQEALGLGPGLSAFLAVLAVSVDGNPLADKVTIGGPSPKVPTLLGSKSTGGIGRHNAYEIDSSLTRQDKYFGNNFVLQGDLYEQMFKTAEDVTGEGVLTHQSQAVFRNRRYQDSAARNPEFKFVPIGVLFFGADHFYIRTLVSSGPDGRNLPATRESLASTVGAKSLGNGKWEYVPERFPDEWYRTGIPYELPEILSHAVISLTYAATHGPSLPLGFNPDKASDPQYVACQFVNTAIEQIPSVLAGIDLVSQFTSQLTGIPQFQGC
ncbi:Cloroperoxidase [Violaceomyces palustris]|uniref:Cloroperoxidase n=1 Tax=Violaceomyces palustris TaxID=1673888 RepID=A0ACD0P1I7_9BASI|nr:Cloroperoxidase [Violaceomyces palustris]